MSSAMSEMRYFTVPSLDLDSLLSVKGKIRQEGLLDSHLKTNLDFSIQALEAFPASKRRDVSLTLEGERHLVRITAGTPVLSYTAHTGANGPQLLQRTHPECQLTTSSLAESHFAGHCCRDELESCFEQAKKALADKSPSVLDRMELKITCGELHLMYSTHQPLHTLHIQPRRRVFLGKTLSLEKILETKTNLEKSGEMRKDLLTCFQHLLQHSDQYQDENARIILQGDGEMLEFVTGRTDNHTTQYFIFTNAQNKAHTQRIQDMELWDGLIVS
ncbi:uncharacterized protein LOC122356134 [Puntigrus tetrazona]|uniref:uncharacterized protein LOC122356134 n=1 Tax=Puntigrus tetrazona TaxID=1606681 RepID=UPI001C8AAC53|nr:uncharacterized protein LOC122356134 [Puntigrus tetrazona]